MKIYWYVVYLPEKIVLLSTTEKELCRSWLDEAIEEGSYAGNYDIMDSDDFLRFIRVPE